MLHPTKGIALAILFAACTSAFAQISAVKKPFQLQKPPKFSQVGNPAGLFVRDQVLVRKWSSTNQQFQTQFLPYLFLSWKSEDRHLEFDLQHIGAAYPHAKLCVYAYQEPAALVTPSGLQLTPVQQLQNQAANSSQCVYSRNILNATPNSHYIIEFGGFTPWGRPNSVSGATSPKPILGGNGEDGNRRNRNSGTKTLVNRDARVVMTSMIRQQSYVRFFIRLEAPGALSSVAAVVDYGEPQPPNSAPTTIEALVTPAKGENPEELWGSERQIYGDNAYVFRWKTQNSAKEKAFWQLSDKPFPADPAQYNDPDYSLSWGLLTEFAQPAIPEGKPVTFFANIAGVFPKQGLEERDFFIRVIQLDKDGALAAPPSNALKLRLLPAPATPDPKDSNYLTFTTELVGYRPPNYGSNQPDRYLLTRTPSSDLDKWIKLTGDPNPHEGDEVYLPPAEPADAKAWYEKVYSAITWCLGAIQSLADDLQTFAYFMDQIFVQLPLRLVNYLGSVAQLDKVAAATGLDQALSAAGWVKGQAFAATNMATHPDYYAASILDSAGVPAADWINLRGKVRSAVAQAAIDSRPTNPDTSGKLLVPDPQYQTHPAFAYLKITAKQMGDKSITLVSKAGTYNLKAMGYYTDPQSPDANKGWQDMYHKSVSMPSMCDGMTMVVPIQLDYDASFYVNPKQWITRYNQTIAMRWLLDYKEIKYLKGNAGWGG